ncbi:hypothetical protein QQZ08_008586 [Neonectria magnoliae]|uniref:Cytochrome P450 n=1 Tax=Neonectria magnoliae TaxID=2732573 RepID=A0ABR1HVD1_9HYPO
MAVQDFVKQILNALWSHCFVTVAVLIAARLTCNRYHKGLQKIPGPFLNSISTIPRIWSVYRSQSHRDDIKLHQRYGKVVRLAPKIVSVSDVSAIDQIYGISIKFVKSEFFKLGAFTDENGEFIPDPFSTQDRNVHSRLKRGAANAYSLGNVVKMEPYVSGVTERLLKLLDDYAECGKVCNLGVILKNYAMDSIFAMSFG